MESEILTTSPPDQEARQETVSKPSPAVNSDSLRLRYEGRLAAAEGSQLVPPAGPLYRALKRAMDLFVSGFLLLLLFPLFLIIALAIVIDDRGPVLYRQKRVGHRGDLFNFWKFRSMVRNADSLKAELAKQNEAAGPIFKMQNDPRITRVGRFLRKYSLDELPQLLSVFLGSMTLIGPRPHLPSEVVHYSDREWLRMSVKPGLMCYREVSGRSKLTFEEWIETDLRYIREQSLAVDCRILLKALSAVLRGDGAC